MFSFLTSRKKPMIDFPILLNIKSIPAWLAVSIISALLLITVGIFCIRSPWKKTKQGRYFTMLVFVVLLIVVFDGMGYIDINGNQGLYILNAFSNVIDYSGTSFMILLWTLFVASNRNVKGGEKRTKFFILTIFLMAIVELVLSILSPFYGIYFGYDASTLNYHRGTFFYIHIIMLGIMVLLSLVMTYLNKPFYEKKRFKEYFLFPLAPYFAIFIQGFLYGVPFGLLFTSIFITVYYVYLQTSNIDMDFLTSCFNRRKLDTFLEDKIDSKGKKPFAVIMMDLDQFKSINDKYGHTVGDDALIEVVKILKSCYKDRDDFVARYGGDEFCFYKETGDEEEVKKTMADINKAIEEFNATSSNHYKIALSMGYSIYDPEKNLSLKEFYSLIDKKMYKNKASNVKKKR